MGSRIKIMEKSYFWVILLMTCVLPLSNKLNSIGIMALLLLWILEGNFRSKFRQLILEPFFILQTLLFCLYLASVWWSEDKSTAWFFVEKNLSVLILPLVLLSGRQLGIQYTYNLYRSFAAIVFLMMSAATILAFREWLNTGDSRVFFYHAFAEHIGLSAIVASLLCCISFNFLCAIPVPRALKGVLLSLFSIWIILLSAKLFILVWLLLLAGYLLHDGTPALRLLTALLLSGIILVISLTNNPVRSRFRDMGGLNISYLQSPVFDKADYFDGLSLRLLYMRFSWAIMQEEKRYWLGTGTGDAEGLLREKIVAHNLYTGNSGSDLEGYLAYSFHNEYLQKFVQLGILGLSLFLGSLGYLWSIGFKTGNKVLLGLLLIFCLSFLTDTLIETQLGLVCYLSFVCLALRGDRRQDLTGK